MRLGIFSRLVLGNIVLLVIAANMCLYAIVELGRVSAVARSIVLADNSLISLDKVLTDAVMSERSYEKKYLSYRDPSAREGFLKAAGEFDQAFVEARRLSIPDEAKDALNTAAAFHRTYLGLVREEAESVKRGEPHARYTEEKDRAVNSALEQLIRLRLVSQSIMADKVKKLSEAGDRARTVGMVVGAVTLVLGIVLSMLITRSITRPLSEMREKTKDIADGVYGTELCISSPTEIGSLARAFNTMCRKLKEVDKLKCDFFSMMSHELRTPLTTIKEGTSLFLEGRAGPTTVKQTRLLTIIAEESSRLIDLVNSVLDLSKIEAGMTGFHFTDADLAPLISRAVAEVGPLAEAKRISLRTETGELPALSVDVERMLQVLRNLIGNALKFTPPGGAVSVTARRAGKTVLVSVSDTGPGIPKESLECIFDKFRQAPCLDRHPGTGLGLAIVKQIVEVHGGKAWAQSEAGSGSTFVVELPA